MNYIHMVSIISGMDLRWPYYVESFLNVQSNVGNVGSQVISVECLILGKEKIFGFLIHIYEIYILITNKIDSDK